jgi:hypothetical protein
MVISSQGQLLDYQFVLSSEESGQLRGRLLPGPMPHYILGCHTERPLFRLLFKARQWEFIFHPPPAPEA